MNIWPRVRTFCKWGSATITFLASVAGLTAFISLYISIQQFNKVQHAAQQDEYERNANLISALALEVEGDLDVCKNILNNKEEALAGNLAIYNYFHVGIIEEVLSTGELTERSIRAALSDRLPKDNVTERNFRRMLHNSYHRMIMLNKMIGYNADLINYESLVKVDDQIRAQTIYRVTTNSYDIISDTEYVSDNLSLCLPIIKAVNSYYLEQMNQ